MKRQAFEEIPILTGGYKTKPRRSPRFNSGVAGVSNYREKYNSKSAKKYTRNGIILAFGLGFALGYFIDSCQREMQALNSIQEKGGIERVVENIENDNE